MQFCPSHLFLFLLDNLRLPRLLAFPLCCLGCLLAFLLCFLGCPSLLFGLPGFLCLLHCRLCLLQHLPLCLENPCFFHCLLGVLVCLLSLLDSLVSLLDSLVSLLNSLV